MSFTPNAATESAYLATYEMM